ncbi:conjugative transposon protein TraK [Nibrella saemangeumensis]|uniref:Conjugative transposon protein TraK n=1 Tax=Nibrella saemangeumensis TaxID=1084526 RepID=A0ABP8NBF3_9BACT
MKNPTNFRYLTNLETSFQMVRWLAFGTVLGSLLFCSVVLYWCIRQVDVSRQNIYALDRGKSFLLTLSQEMNENRPAEAEDHIKTFHKLFFELDPNENQINAHIREASYLGDQSVVRLYKDLKEKGYFTQLIQGNVIQKVEVDSVQIHYNQSPFYAKTYARQILIRANSVTIRRLITHCYLLETQRSVNNSHGFMIERFKVLDNQDLETIEREGNKAYAYLNKR